MAIGEVTLPLVTAFQRLIDLLAEPKDIPILALTIHRGNCLRLFVGDQGARLGHMASARSQSPVSWFTPRHQRGESQMREGHPRLHVQG